MAVLDPDPSESRGARRRRARRRRSAAARGRRAGARRRLARRRWRRPSRRGAIAIDPLDPIEDVLGAGVDAVTGGIGGMAVEGLGAIVKALFAWPAKIINRELLAWLVAVPDYAIHPETARAGR